MSELEIQRAGGEKLRDFVESDKDLSRCNLGLARIQVKKIVTASKDGRSGNGLEIGNGGGCLVILAGKVIWSVGA